jgi:cytochrome c oxidase cbb3-type subunit 3
MSPFWSAWIIILTVVCTAGFTWLLFANRKSKNMRPDGTTGHVYDGIEEYDNPLPAWWFYLFVITIVFGVGYVIAYPGLGSFQGLLGWSQEGQLRDEQEAAQAKYGPLFAAYAAQPVPELAQDRQAMKMGQRLFANNCAQCHGADARGSFGFPNLTDDEWLWGGAPEQLVQTIGNGRQGAMPGWSAALGDDGIRQVTAYVVTLGGREADAADAAAGEEKFGMYCVACHGADGKGNPLLGAPDLTDDNWLYGGSPLMIAQTIRTGRNGVMPAHREILSGDKIHLLAAYVYSLSHAAE